MSGQWKHDEIERLEQIIEIMREVLSIPSQDSLNELVSVHLPARGRCFQLKPEAFCNMAQKIAESDEFWQSVDQTLGRLQRSIQFRSIISSKRRKLIELLKACR